MIWSNTIACILTVELAAAVILMLTSPPGNCQRVGFPPVISVEFCR